MAEHTPTPWEVCVCKRPDSFHLQSRARHWSLAAVYYMVGCTDASQDVPEAEAEANAAFIVKACNAHEALVGFVQEIADMSPSTFERGDDPAFLIEAAKAALKALALTSAHRAPEGKS